MDGLNRQRAQRTLPRVGFLGVSLWMALVFGITMLGARGIAHLAHLHAVAEDHARLLAAVDEYEGEVRLLNRQFEELEELGSRVSVMLSADELAFPAWPGDRVLPAREALVEAGDAVERLGILRTSLGNARKHAEAHEAGLLEAMVDLEEHMENFERVPSILPARGWLSASFGYRKDPFTGNRAFHSGIDVAAFPGTEIVATARGRVTFSGRNAGYGRQVRIDHGNGFTTTYSHNRKNLVRRGDLVDRGQVIAHVGSSGRSTSSHVHYEIHEDGKKVNPWSFVLPDDEVVD